MQLLEADLSERAEERGGKLAVEDIVRGERRGVRASVLDERGAVIYANEAWTRRAALAGLASMLP